MLNFLIINCRLLENSSEVATPLISAVQKTKNIMFPNIHTILRIMLTLPVTTCTCERRISVLNSIKSFNRTTQIGLEQWLFLFDRSYQLLIDKISCSTEHFIRSEVALLDILVTPLADNSLSISVYHRPTHTDQYLQLDSHHSLSAKYSVIGTLTHRAKTVYNLSHIWDRVLFNTPGLKLSSPQQSSAQT